jgi:hypothetical protein
MNQATMSEPSNFVLSQLTTGFRDELHALLALSWLECTRQGFSETRTERALLSSALSEVFDLAVESMGPEESARFVSAVVNERLKSFQQR